MKKLISMFVVFCFLCANITCICYATENEEKTLYWYGEKIKERFCGLYPLYEYEITDIVDSLVASEVMISVFNSDGADSIYIIEDTIMDAVSPAESEISTYAFDQSTGVYYSPNTVPYIRQTETNYCGPASVLQALIGNGIFPNIDSYKTSSMQDFIAYRVGMTEDSTSANISDMCNYMNTHYTNATFKYKVKAFNGYTFDKARGYVTKSLQLDGCPIYRVQYTSNFNYYNGNDFQHFVTISRFDSRYSTVTIVDPHYISNYSGTHTITLEEFYDSIKYTYDPNEPGQIGGWFAVISTDTSNNPYIYE